MTTLSLQAETLRITVDLAPPTLTLCLEGELDLACADLIQAVTRVEIATVSIVIIDLSDLSFTDTAGLDALLAFRSLHLADARDVQLINASPLIRRMCRILGQEQCLAA